MSEKKKSEPKPEAKPEAKPSGLTPPQKKALFDKYEELVQKEQGIEDQLEQIRQDKSLAIQHIEDMLGKGPFEWKEEIVLITKRKSTYYFRSRGKVSVEKIG